MVSESFSINFVWWERCSYINLSGKWSKTLFLTWCPARTSNSSLGTIHEDPNSFSVGIVSPVLLHRIEEKSKPDQRFKFSEKCSAQSSSTDSRSLLHLRRHFERHWSSLGTTDFWLEILTSNSSFHFVYTVLISLRKRSAKQEKCSP